MFTSISSKRHSKYTASLTRNRRAEPICLTPLLRQPLHQTQLFLSNHPPLTHHRSSRHRRRTLSCSSCSNHTHPCCILSVRSPARPPRPPIRPDHSILTHSKRRRGRGLCIPSHHSTRRLPCELHRYSPSPRRPRSHSSIRIRPHLLLLQLLPRPQRSRGALY